MLLNKLGPKLSTKLNAFSTPVLTSLGILAQALENSHRRYKIFMFFFQQKCLLCFLSPALDLCRSFSL